MQKHATQPAVRLATPADLAAIQAIYAHAVLYGTASFELTPPDMAEMTRRYDAIVHAGYPYLVATRDVRVLGYAYINAYRPRPAYRFSVEDSIYIAPGEQRRGVGQALLSDLIERCTVANFRQMIAVIGDSAQSASIGLHRRHGFNLVGTIHNVGFKNGRWLDSVIMQRSLGTGHTTLPA